MRAGTTIPGLFRVSELKVSWQFPVTWATKMNASLSFTSDGSDRPSACKSIHSFNDRVKPFQYVPHDKLLFSERQKTTQYNCS